MTEITAVITPTVNHEFASEKPLATIFPTIKVGTELAQKIPTYPSTSRKAANFTRSLSTSVSTDPKE